MATFLSTMRFTEQGLKDVKSTCQRADDFRSAAADRGVVVKELFWCLGAMDGVLIFDAPDEETATAAMLHLGSVGNVQTQTVRVFGTEEMAGILSKFVD